MDFKFVSGPCGSAKTTKKLQQAIQQTNALGENFLISSPTKNLIDQSKQTINTASPNLAVFPFHSRIQSNVGEALQRHLLHNMNDPQIILTTEATMINTREFPNARNINFVSDEVPNPIICHSYNVPDRYSFITDLLTLEEGTGPYAKIIVKDAQLLNKYRSDKDDINKIMKSLAEIIANPNYDSYARRDQWTVEKITQISIFSVLKPDFLMQFKTVTFLSACFEQSLVYLLWQQMGVKFSPDMEIMNQLYFSKNQLHGRSVRIHYLTGTKNWSKAIQDKLDFQQLAKVIQSIMRDDQYIYCANNGIEDFLPGERISSSVRGLNSYQHYNKAVFLSALNDKPEQYRFLEAMFGISAEQLCLANMCQAAYQFVYRTSLRNQYSTDAVDIIVPTLQIAEFLASQCEGTNIEIKPINHKIKILNDNRDIGGRPRSDNPSNRALYERARREKQKEKNNIESATIIVEEPQIKLAVCDDYRPVRLNTLIIKHNILQGEKKKNNQPSKELIDIRTVEIHRSMSVNQHKEILIRILETNPRPSKTPHILKKLLNANTQCNKIKDPIANSWYSENYHIAIEQLLALLEQLGKIT